MMEVFILKEKNIKPNPLIILVIKEYRLIGSCNFPWKIRIAFSQCNYEDLKDMVSGVCKLQIIQLIQIVLNLTNLVSTQINS